MSDSVILESFPLGFPWPTLDPFLFCVYHLDEYPQGTEALGPDPGLLAGREIGQDFTIKDGWRMYHGDVVPGFPQWMTAGKGIQHAEMFPLLSPHQPNPNELFQIWLNLPRAKKFVEPYYGMLWQEKIPTWESPPEAGPAVSVKILAGSLAGLKPPAPPPDSWAADPANQVAIWTITLAAHATWTLPAAGAELNRCLYYYQGQGLKLAEQNIGPPLGLRLKSDAEVQMLNGPAESRLLLLQGKPIAEPVTQYGPFVMNSEAEIRQAFRDYQRDQFGGWPWPASGPVMPREQGRFARYADGRLESPDQT
ncbi:MAG: pirin [Candidatus Melainabacteria bacterium HGW-Melainabacteria-1]|nr:MAG: pirin [Candidatus Melainabacteria bacterium HGW-Melainabacteria-1]